MFEEIVSSLLSRFLGDYIENVEAKDLKLGLLGGDIQLHDLKIKGSALSALNLPVEIKAGFLGSLVLKVPWTSLGSKPTIVEVSDVYALACPKSEVKFDPEAEEASELASKRKQIQSINDSSKRRDAALNEKSDNSMIGRLIAKIIDNFQLKVSRVHIRLEDSSSNKNHPFGMGILLNELHVLTVDNKGRPTNAGSQDTPTPGVIRKHISINGFALYWDSDITQSMPSDSKDFCNNMKIPFDLWKNTVPDLLPEAITSTFSSNETKERTLEDLTPFERSLVPQEYILTPVVLGMNFLMDNRGFEVRKPNSDIATNKALEEMEMNKEHYLSKHAKKVFMYIKEDGIRGRSEDEELQLYLDTFVEYYPRDINGQYRNVLIEYYHKAWDIINTPSPVMKVTMNMSKYGLCIEKNQYRDILSFTSALSMQSLKAKYKRFKPEGNVKSNISLLLYFVVLCLFFTYY
ncbi:hypothetical protein WA158_007239 [Blastocystis sp. Blastoise]